MHHQGSPREAQFGGPSFVESAETGWIGQQIAVLTKGGGVLLIDSQRQMRERIEDRNRRKSLRRYPHIECRQPLLIVPTEHGKTREAPPSQRASRPEMELVGVRPAQRGRNRGVRSAEAHQHRSLFPNLKLPVGVAVHPLIHASTETVRVPEIQISARQGRIQAKVAARETQPFESGDMPGQARSRRHAIPDDHVRLRREGPGRREIPATALLRRQ